jgi:L-asparagine permease
MGILTTLAVYLVGVGLNYLIPARVFEIVLNFSAVGIISTWAFILLCQQRLRAAINRGDIAPTSFAMPGAPFTNWITLGFLAFVLLMIAFDYPDGTITMGATPLIGLLLVGGWVLLGKTRKTT